ncbi:unnamed protein product [Dovyalis caffra]|uniref:Uncharacterized protein n=1 Tax=Dovyalis caffra TaxID=77055 RepID=A0AAV1QQG5_9ROSI|nr:unnamed protein product [Dovyalis caffra]
MGTTPRHKRSQASVFVCFGGYGASPCLGPCFPSIDSGFESKSDTLFCGWIEFRRDLPPQAKEEVATKSSLTAAPRSVLLEDDCRYLMCKPEGLELLDVAQCCYNLTTKKLCLELQPLRVGHGATASDAPHHCEKRGLAHQPTLPRVSVARTGSEIQRIAAKGGMIAARCKPEVTSGGPASKAHYPDYPNEMIEAGLHLELLWLPHTPTSPCNFHFKSTPKSIHQRATLTAKRAEQLELDERRGCNFKEARPDPRTGQKTGPTTGVGNFLKHARLPRVLVSALTLSLKWLSNLSMGNRGFLPGLLADACKYFLPALGRGYRHWPRTKNSLKPRYWIEQEARNLSLLLVLPSLWLTGFSSHTSGGGGRRVQLPLEIGNLFLELPLILGSQLLGGIWLLWNDQEGMVEESHWKLEDARLLILSGVSSSSSIVDGLREHHLVWQHLSVTLTNAFEEICNVELEGVESAVQQVETRKMIREECDDGEQLILSRLPELKASKSLSFLVGSFFLAVFLLSSSSHSLVAKRIHSRKKEILYYTTNTVCNGNLKPKELARMDGLVSKQPDSLAQSHRSWISFGQNRRLERLQRGYEDEGLLGLEWSLFRVWVKDWLKSNVSGTLSPDVSIQQFFLAPILCRSWKSIRTDKQFVRFGLKGKVYDMVAVKALDEGSGLTLSFLIIEVTRIESKALGLGPRTMKEEESVFFEDRGGSDNYAIRKKSSTERKPVSSPTCILYLAEEASDRLEFLPSWDSMDQDLLLLYGQYRSTLGAAEAGAERTNRLVNRESCHLLNTTLSIIDSDSTLLPLISAKEEVTNIESEPPNDSLALKLPNYRGSTSSPLSLREAS